MRRHIFLMAALLGVAGPGAIRAQWQTYTQCRLRTDEYGDGDSFHVQTARRDYIFRLYFVDCPETDGSLADRIKDQAAYWDISPQDVIRLGKKAEEFTRAALSREFTVQTRKEDAQGNSRAPRYYAIVTDESGRDLAEALVENGLARVYGRAAEPGGGLPERKMWQRLEAAERRAKERKAGGWADEYHRARRPSLPAVPSIWSPAGATHSPPAEATPEKIYRQKLPLTKSAVFFDPDRPDHPAGWLRPGTTVIVLRAGPEGLICVRVEGDETKRELLCRPADLGL